VQPSGEPHGTEPSRWDDREQAKDAAARRDAVRLAHARGPGSNLEEAIRMIRAGEAMRGIARR
jgi:hypothetical protein